MPEPKQIPLADMNAIMQFGPITSLMRRCIPRMNRKFAIPNMVGYSDPVGTIYLDRDLLTRQLIYLGRPVDVDRFLIMRALVEKSIIDCVETGENRDVQRILIAMRMLSKDDALYDHAHAVATTAELYTVRMQHGGSGVKTYLAFLDQSAKRIADVDEAALPPDLDRHYLGASHAQD